MFFDFITAANSLQKVLTPLQPGWIKSFAEMNKGEEEAVLEMVLTLQGTDLVTVLVSRSGEKYIQTYRYFPKSDQGWIMDEEVPFADLTYPLYDNPKNDIAWNRTQYVYD